jgi:hypothetical protein
MKRYGRVDVQNDICFIAVLVGGEWSAEHIRRFILGIRAPFILGYADAAG